MEIVVAPSTRPGSKWMATTGDRTVHFGAAGYEDYTHHKDPDRRRVYIQRHRRGEDWTRSGLPTPGWLS